SLAILLFLIIIGGIKRIAKVTEKIVPVMGIIYILGALTVIFANYQNIIPSFGAVFAHVFTGHSALGGLAGASFALAFRQGVGQGIFSNEAGQGSAAIAHSAAIADEPISEGMVSSLGPFIDTIIICTLTGLTILSSGVWKEKADGIVFQRADMEVVAGVYDENNKQDAAALWDHINRKKGNKVKPYSGKLILDNGRIQAPAEVTVIHARSIAENMVFKMNGQPLTGALNISDGRLNDASIQVIGRSRIHSAMLTAEAFKRGFFGDKGDYIVSIGLLLFAFSTVISWSYYGDRAMTYLFGLKSVLPYRLVYIVVFFLGALMDTTVVWNFANIAIVLMALPNLFGILLLHKDMKKSIAEYWVKFKKEHPEDAEKMRVLS
ncbi:amino acid carrier protein, partial [bacterium]|nr:amino acid carrier protein [bacterium]